MYSFIEPVFISGQQCPVCCTLHRNGYKYKKFAYLTYAISILDVSFRFWFEILQLPVKSGS